MASVIAPPSHAARRPASVERRKPMRPAPARRRGPAAAPPRPTWTSIRDNGVSSRQCAQAQGDHPQPVAPPRGVPRRRPGPAGPLVLESSRMHRRGHRVLRVPASIPRCAFCARRRDVGVSSPPTPVRMACPGGRVATGMTPGRNERRARILNGRRSRGNRPRRPSVGRRRHRPECTRRSRPARPRRVIGERGDDQRPGPKPPTPRPGRTPSPDAGPPRPPGL